MKRIIVFLLAAFVVALSLVTCSKDDDITKPVTTGSIIFSSYPSGATYTVDSLYLSGTTPDTVRDIQAGSYEVRMELKGFNPSVDTVTVVAGKEIEYHKYLSQGKGAVQFITTPDSAAVVMSHHDTLGYTPCVLTELLANPYTFELQKPGYKRLDTTIEILTNDTITVSVKLDTLLTWVHVTSTPDNADIYIDSENAPMQSPIFDSLPPGKHSFRAELQGYQSQSKTLTLKAFDTVDVVFKMVLITGTVNISSTPKGASIDVDGLPSGSMTPINLKLVPGNHRLTLRKAGYYDIDTTITVVAEQTVSLDLTLEAKPTSLAISSVPTGANIAINGEATGFTTPHVFNDISPGTYNLRLTLAGFFPVDSNYVAILGTENQFAASFDPAPDIPFAYTVRSLILLSNTDGIVTDTLSKQYDDWIESYISYQGEIRWSPDGKYLAFSGDKYAVSIVTSDGTWFRGFKGNRSMDFSWSPNSNELVWGVYCGGLYKNVISTNWYGRITSGCYDNSPAYRPSGNKILFMYHNWGISCRIDRCNPNGSKRQNIYGWFRAGFDEYMMTVWSSDSTALFKINGAGLYQILLPDSGHVKLTKLVDDNVTRFRISANRKYVAYKTSSGIYFMRVGEWNPVRIIGYKCYDFAVTNDGQYVLCCTSSGVHFVDLQGHDYYVLAKSSKGRGAIDIKP